MSSAPDPSLPTDPTQPTRSADRAADSDPQSKLASLAHNLTVETPDGKVIGKHQGLMYHTIGQRQGLGIGGLAEFGDEPWYVAEKDLSRNVLIAVQGKNHPLLFSRGLVSGAIDWVAGEPPAQQSAASTSGGDD
mgnify:CR=1 FL=1